MKLNSGLWKIRYPIFFLLVAAAALISIHLSLNAYPFDDSYIHFRIAKYLARFGAPYFNPGEAVNASSSPAWTIFLWAIILILQIFDAVSYLPRAIGIINACLTLAGAITYTYLLDKLTQAERYRFVHAIFFVVYIAISLIPSIGLMETPAALLLVGVSLILLTEKNPLACIGFGLAPFLRPEFSIITVLVVVYVLIYRPFAYRWWFSYLLLGFLPVAFYNYYFFGSLIPATIRAKSLVYDIPRLAVYYSIVYSIVPNFFLFRLGAFAQYFVQGLVLALFLLTNLRVLNNLLHSFSIKKIDPLQGLDIIGLGWGIGVICAYILFRTFLFAWYTPLFLIPVWFSICKAWIDARTNQTAFWSYSLLTAPVIFFQFLTILLVFLGAWVNTKYYPEFLSGARVRQYLQIGAEIKEKYPDATILTTEIGALGYSFDGYIYDGVGLVSPAALKYHPMKVGKERSDGFVGAIPVNFVKEVNPDIIIGYDIFMEAFLKSRVKANYVHLNYPILLKEDIDRSGVDSLWNSKSLNVFIRKDVWISP